jgi:uncharacterized protein YrzB (UPF0473 family)
MISFFLSSLLKSLQILSLSDILNSAYMPRRKPMSENEKELHQHDADCCCDEEEDLGTVTLTLEDDTDVECAILAIYPVEGKQYIALLPIDENGEAKDDEDVFIYRYVDNGEDKDPDLENIEDDAEYEAAADAFDELLDEDEFDEEDPDNSSDQ